MKRPDRIAGASRLGAGSRKDREDRWAPARFALAALTFALFAACGEPEPAWRSPVDFDTAQVRIVGSGDTARILVEVAETPEQRAFGLMVRPSLDPGSGMIFLHDTIQSDSSTFWMWRTRMPLDIAFLDSTGTILSVISMQPCESPYQRDCPVYGPGVEYSSALEVNRGWFEENAFGLGDRVILDRQ